MWWVESTPSSSPIIQSTSHAPQAPAGLSDQLPVDKSASSSKIAQKLYTDIERLEALVANANSRFAVVQQQSAAEAEAHSTIVSNLQRRHDDETAALRKQIAELQHSQTEAAKVQEQKLVEFASRQSEQASQIEAAEHAARLASEKTVRLRGEYEASLVELEVQAKMVAQQSTQLHDLQTEKSQLLEHMTAAIGNCQQIKTELQLKNAALIDSNYRLDAIVSAQSALQARLQQQQVEQTRQIEEIEQKTHLAKQEEQRQHELETQALWHTISGLEQSLAQSVSAQSALQAKLQQQQVEQTRQIEEIEQKAHLANQEEQRQHELETQALQHTISGLEQSLAQSVSAQSALQAKLQQQQVEQTRQIEEITQRTCSAAAQADLQMTQLHSESQAYREMSLSEIAALKHLLNEFEIKQSQSQATLDCQTTKLREQEELLRTAISERERLAVCCHELRDERQQATGQWQARLRSESEKLEALAQQLALLEQCRANEIAKYAVDVRQLTERYQGDNDALRSTIFELNQAHNSSQRDLREQQGLLELREAEYRHRLEEVEQNASLSVEQSHQQCLNLRNELDQTIVIHSGREKQHEEHCAKLLSDITGLTQAVVGLQSRQTESHAKFSAQELVIEQRGALVESLRIENERLSVQYRELAASHSQLCDQWTRSVEQEAQAREAADALQEVERALRGQVQSQAEQILNLQAEAEQLSVTHQHQSQAHRQGVEELRAEISSLQSLLELQNQQLSQCRSEFQVLRSSLADAKNAQELARRDSDENAQSAQKLRGQCLLLQDQLQKAAAARRMAESALIRAAELADPNSIAQITRREIKTHQAVERLLLELKSTRLVCLNLNRQSSSYQKEIERLKSKLHSTKAATFGNQDDGSQLLRRKL